MTKNEILLSNSPMILRKFGMFQIRSLILLSLPASAVGMFTMSFVFLNVVPPFHCIQLKNLTEKSSSQSLNDSDKNIKIFPVENQCFRNQSSAFTHEKIISNNETIFNSTYLKESCLNRINFDTSDGNTAVSQFGLVCESSWKRPVTTGSMIVGTLFGTIIGGRFADRFGRRFTTLLTLLTSAVLGFITAFSSYYWLYVSFLFFFGAVYVLTYLNALTWSIEIAGSADKRVWASFTFNASFSLGGMLMSLIAYLAKDWSLIYITEGLYFLFCLVMTWFVHESPVWLLQKKNQTKAIDVLEKIVNMNKIDVADKKGDFSELKSFKQQSQAQVSNVEDKELPGSLLWKNRVLRRRLILSCLLWNIFILSQYTMILNSANLGGNAYVNNIIGSALDIAALSTTTLVLKKRSRKCTLIAGMIGLGCFCIAFPFTKQGFGILGICFAMAGRFFATAVAMVSILFTGEIFPTMLRSTAICIASTFSRSSAILSPFLIYAGEEVDLSIPFYVMGGFAFISVFLIFLLPEASGSFLVSTLEDALSLKDPRLILCCTTNSKKTFGKQKRKKTATSGTTNNDQILF